MKHLILTFIALYITVNASNSYAKVRMHRVHDTIVSHARSTTHQLLHMQTGIASWYGYESGSRYRHAPRTASGAIFSPHKLTAAHRTLPFGTKVQVTNLSNKHIVVVTINDRGPFIRGRIIDLSKAAAIAIGMHGCQKVAVSVIG